MDTDGNLRTGRCTLPHFNSIPRPPVSSWIGGGEGRACGGTELFMTGVQNWTECSMRFAVVLIINLQILCLHVINIYLQPG